MNRAAAILSAVGLLSVLCGAAFAQAPATAAPGPVSASIKQETTQEVNQASVDAAVNDLISATKALKELGKGTRMNVRIAAREHAPEVLPVADEIRSQLRKAETRDGVEQEAIDKACKEFVLAAAKLVRLGIPASEFITASLKKLEDEDLKAVVRRADLAIYIIRARSEIEKFQNKGTFLGMYQHLRPLNPKLLEAALVMAANKELAIVERDQATTLIAELANAKDPAILKQLRDIHDAEDPNLATNLRRSCAMTMARLGDFQLFEELLAPYKKALEEEALKEKPEVGRYVGLCLFIAQQYERICAYDRTLTFYVRALINYVGTPIDRFKPNDRLQVSNNLYNMACSASRLKDVELALWSVDQSFNYGGTNFEWAMEDGDLENVRSDPRFSVMVEEWKAGKRKVNQQPDPQQLVKLAEKYLAPRAANESRPVEPPQSKPAEGAVN